MLLNVPNFTADPLLFKFGEQYQDAMESFNSPRGHVPSPSEEMINNRNKHLKWFDEKFTNIIKGKYVYDSIGGFISQDTGDVRPWHSSSGQQETLPIYLVLRNYLYDRLSFGMSGSLYIEEPEAHLYPTAQKDILELFIYVANTINSDGLYITTHSPYILTVLNNLILANDVKEKQNIFDKDLLVPFEEVRAYYIADGAARDLRDTENRLILADNLDKVSEQTAMDFDKLLDMKYD